MTLHPSSMHAYAFNHLFILFLLALPAYCARNSRSSFTPFPELSSPNPSISPPTRQRSASKTLGAKISGCFGGLCKGGAVRDSLTPRDAATHPSHGLVRPPDTAHFSNGHALGSLASDHTESSFWAGGHPATGHQRTDGRSHGTARSSAPDHLEVDPHHGLESLSTARDFPLRAPPSVAARERMSSSSPGLRSMRRSTTNGNLVGPPTRPSMAAPGSGPEPGMLTREDFRTRPLLRGLEPDDLSVVLRKRAPLNSKLDRISEGRSEAESQSARSMGSVNGDHLSLLPASGLHPV